MEQNFHHVCVLCDACFTMAMSGLLSSCSDNNGSSHSASVTWQEASDGNSCQKGASPVVIANRHGTQSHVVKYVLHQQPAKMWYLLDWTADGTVTSKLQKVSLNCTIVGHGQWTHLREWPLYFDSRWEQKIIHKHPCGYLFQMTLMGSIYPFSHSLREVLGGGSFKSPINPGCMSLEAEYPHKHGENIQTPNRKVSGLESVLGPSCCETTVLTTAPICFIINKILLRYIGRNDLGLL